MSILKKSAYIKGLMDGLDLDKNTNEGKILSKIIDLLEDICEEVCNVKEDINDVWKVVDDVDEDLKKLEDFAFSNCDSKLDDYFCVKCPNCGQEHYMRYSDLTTDELEDGEIKCPNCKAKIDLDKCLVCDEEIGNCDCGKINCNCNDDDNCGCNK